MMNKVVLLAFILFLQSGVIWSEARGPGYDIIHPSPVCDPDLIQDEGAFATSFTKGSSSNRDISSLYASLALNKFSKNSALSVSFLLFNYDFSREFQFSNISETGDVTGRQFALELFYNRSILKFSFDETWFPTQFTVSWYAGVGLSQAKTDISLTNRNGIFPTSDELGIRGGDVSSGSSTFLPVSMGFIADYSVNKRYGFETYVHVNQDFLTSNDAFKRSPRPVMTIGFNNYLRKGIYNAYPLEFSLGLNYTIRSNDIDSSNLAALNFGFRRRW